jgi:hypothetical protein
MPALLGLAAAAAAVPSVASLDESQTSSSSSGFGCSLPWAEPVMTICCGKAKREASEAAETSASPLPVH